MIACAGLAVLFFVGYHALRPAAPANPTQPSVDPRPLLEAGERALRDGEFRIAADKLAAAQRAFDQSDEPLPRSDRRRLEQLHREAALLADLLTDSLEEIVLRAAGSSDDEWKSQFAHRYQSKALVFDVQVARLGKDELQLDYALQAGAEPARIDVHDVKLLAALPIEQRSRLVFGVRLGSIRREPPGVWVVRFQPNSGVLLTDPGAAAACCPQAVDEELQHLLDRQREWAATLSEDGAARSR